MERLNVHHLPIRSPMNIPVATLKRRCVCVKVQLNTFIILVSYTFIMPKCKLWIFFCRCRGFLFVIEYNKLYEIVIFVINLLWICYVELGILYKSTIWRSNKKYNSIQYYYNLYMLCFIPLYVLASSAMVKGNDKIDFQLFKVFLHGNTFTDNDRHCKTCYLYRPKF